MPHSHLYDTLIDADTLRLNLGNPDWRVIDCRHDLLHPESGRESYAQSHIAGAAFAHLDRDLSAPRTVHSGRHPLPDPDQLAARFRRWGIGPDTQIVAYDASAGSYAARLWWLARWLGHERVAVLDGGWPAALKAGLTIDSAEPRVPEGRFERGQPLEQPADLDAVQAVRSDPLWQLIDARSPDRYAGRNETIDPIGGHIPGAVNRFWQSNLGADGRFKPAAQLRSEFAALLGQRPASRVIAQCGSGVTACHHLLAMRHCGLDGARLYPGSWSEWITDPARPVAIGDAP